MPSVFHHINVNANIITHTDADMNINTNANNVDSIDNNDDNTG